jgi:DNA-binding CsgD family transcriptional regulator/tetratricopeptide (TPR) repeat protein
MPLLERDLYLVELEARLSDATVGRGHMVLLGGKAGVGKTALVTRLAEVMKGRATVLIGACDPLSTPRPLGPLLDIAPSVGGALARALRDDTGRERVFTAFLATLTSARRPILVVFEDVHWADDATLDLLRYLGRRIGQSRAILIATYRDDELGPKHPLRTLIGDLATASTAQRMTLTPLSERAVRVLAEASGMDPVALHRRTAGNPFFVTEVLAARQLELPVTVRDAVLARLTRLHPSARAMLNAAAVVGMRIEPWLLSAVAGDDTEAVDACLATGMLRSDGGVLTFHHQLVREAVLAVLPAHHDVQMHARIVAALRLRPSGPDDLARLAHHAEAAGDYGAALELARAAAQRAVALGSHREAAAQYARVLRFANPLPTVEHAELLDAYAQECFVTDQLSAGIPARTAALEIWRRVGNQHKEGESLTWLARAMLLSGEPHADTLSGAAIAVLESLPPGPALARAYRVHAHLRIEAGDALHYGQRAIELAERLHDVETLVAASNTVGTALLLGGQDEGREYLERSLQLAREAELDDYVGLAFTNLGSALGEHFQLRAAEDYLSRGIAYCTAHDVDRHRLYMQAWQALVWMYQGRWMDAATSARQVLDRPGASAISRMTALLALGRVHARRGEQAEATDVLDLVLELAATTTSLHRVGPVRIARAEAAWLAGDYRRTRVEARSVFEAAVEQHHAWHSGALAFWRWRVGDLKQPPHGVAAPFELQIAGDWIAAAAAWRSRDCPYEEAQALADGDEPALLEALAMFEGLGARPMAERTKRRLRACGIRGIPRGPRPATRAHPALLTPRQTEVLWLLASGLSNSQISAQLVLSERTVVHHVSAILAKLGVKSRADAALRAVTIARDA